MKADYVHKDTRTIVVDGVEIQTSLSAVEIADLYQKNQELKKENEKLHHYKTLYQSLKKQKEELRDYLNARIDVCDNRLSTPFCNIEKATKERLILNQCLEKLEELEMVTDDKIN